MIRRLVTLTLILTVIGYIITKEPTCVDELLSTILLCQEASRP